MKTPPLYYIVKSLFRLLELEIPSQLLHNSVQMRQAGLSLINIREVLLDFGVGSKSYLLSSVELQELEAPSVVQILRNGKEELVVLRKWDRDGVFILIPGDKETVLDQKTFEHIFTGACLIPFTDEYSGIMFEHITPNNGLSSLMSHSGTIVLYTISILFLWWSSVYEQIFFPILTFLIGLKLLGLWITAQIIKIELNKDDGLIRRVCQRNDCHKVLHSKAAKPTSWLSMGDLGVVYFGGSLLALFCFVGLKSYVVMLPLLACTTFLALPYTFFSVYYQKMIAKVWCPFCLSVVVLFWIEAIGLLYWFSSHLFTTDISAILRVGLCFGAIFSLWMVIRKLLSDREQGMSERRFIDYVKRNTQLFKAMLSMEQEVPPFPSETAPRIGNKFSKHKIILILSPSCPSCVEILNQAIEFVGKHHELIEVTFCLKSSNESSSEGQVIEWMLSAYLSRGITGMVQLQKIWIEIKDKHFDLFEEMAESRGFHKSEIARNIRIETQAWYKSTAITTTPSLIYNRKVVPMWYLFSNLITQIIRMEHEAY